MSKTKALDQKPGSSKGSKRNPITDRRLKWKSNLPGLLEEVLNNHGAAALKMPILITRHILIELGERAIKINDPILNEILCDLQIYQTPEPASEEYSAFMAQVRKASRDQKRKEANLENKKP